MAIHLSDAELKAAHAENFDRLNEIVHGEPFDQHLRFLNFGYRPLPGERRLGPRLGPSFPNRDSAQLLFQVVGDTEIDGRDLVEVGCGRGGNLWLLGRTYEPASLTGIDISPRCIDFARTSSGGDPSIRFEVGDAEDLPLDARSVDIVLSIETSCGYPRIDRFFREVARVLRPAGRFLWADLLPTDLVEPYLEVLSRCGLEVDEQRDISDNVLAAREALAAKQARVFANHAQQGSSAMDEFVGHEGSRLRDLLTDRGHRYLLFRLTRTGGDTLPEGDLLAPAHLRAVRENVALGVELLTMPPLADDEPAPRP